MPIVHEPIAVELYAINSRYDNLTIPDSYRQNYQIDLVDSRTVTYKTISGKRAKVSDSGYIEPAGTVFYYYGGWGTTVSTGAEGEIARVEYDYDDTTMIEACTENEVFQYIVTIKNYAQTYAEQVMDSYIEKNITDSMTNREKLNKIAEFPCQYDYSARYSSAISMIINGGGDCWASTDAIIELSRKIGFEAKSRDGRNDPGAESGHMNALVKVDDKWYIVDAGYVGSAPRTYTIEQSEDKEN